MLQLSQLFGFSRREAANIGRFVSKVEIKDGEVTGECGEAISRLHEKLVERRKELLAEAVSADLLYQYDDDAKDWQIEADVLEALEDEDLLGDELLMLRLLATFMPASAKLRSKSVTVEKERVLLAINSGRGVYTYEFPRTMFVDLIDS